MRFLRHRLDGIAALALVTLAAAGCSRGHGESSLSGQVRIDGKPLRGGFVRFVPVENGQQAVGATIDESGNYGPVAVTTGKVMVTVDNRSLAPQVQDGGGPTHLPQSVNPELRAKMAARAAAAKAPPKNPDYTAIPSRYYLAETSELTFTVEPGEQKHDIELSSKP